MKKLKFASNREKLKIFSNHGGLYCTDKVADLTGLGHKCVSSKRKRKELLALFIDNKWEYPAFQFEENKIIPGLSTIIKILCSRDDMFWDACLFLLNNHGALTMTDGTDLTPLECIMSGERLNLVASLAHGRFDQSAN